MPCLDGEASAQYCNLTLTQIYNTTLFQNDLTFLSFLSIFLVCSFVIGRKRCGAPICFFFPPKYEQAYLFVFIF